MNYALRGERYPIETEEQIKVASDYFTNNLPRFSPSDRVEVATNMKKRAEELGIDLDVPWVSNYSRMMNKQADYSPDFEYTIRLFLCSLRIWQSLLLLSFTASSCTKWSYSRTSTKYI